MVMGRIWCLLLLVSISFAFFTGQGTALAGSVTQGAQAGVELALAMAGSLCLWSGVGRLLFRTGVTRWLSSLLMPLLRRLFPETGGDPALAGDLSTNICANLLGLGNAATPSGMAAARRLARGDNATDSLCRLVVLNTASIQLIPATVAALRSSLGCQRPFDILLPVWITSFCAAAAGLMAAWGMGRVWKA